MPVWQNHATLTRLGIWIHWWRRSNHAELTLISPERTEGGASPEFVTLHHYSDT